MSRAHKSTNSGKGGKDEEEQCQKIIDEIFTNKVEGPRVSEDPTINLSNVKDVKREQVPQTVSSNFVTNRETDSETCHKLIAQAFGKDGDVDKSPKDAITAATTAKQTEEQLAQKVETIDETPLVEAAKPKMEGFNVKPKVLGAEEQIGLEKLYFDKFEGKDVPAAIMNEKTNKGLDELCEKIERGNRFYHAGKNLYQMPQFNPFDNSNPLDTTQTGTTHVNHPYDDIAKRCINIPPNKVDLYILKELERLGVPNSGGYGSNSDNIDNTDDINQQMNMKYNFQSGNFGDTWPNDQVQNSPHENERSICLTSNKKPMPLCMMDQHVIDNTIMSLAAAGPKPAYSPQRMLLDPFDKKSLCHDCVDPEYDTVSYENVHVLVQNLERKYTGQNAEGEKTVNLQQNEAPNTEHSEQTQSAEQTQSYSHEYQDYEIKPICENPRLPNKAINYCKENLTKNPANQEQHYPMDKFQDGVEPNNQMYYKENMVPNPPNNQQQGAPQYYWSSDYQYSSNYYENRFKGDEEHHQTTPEENLPEANLPNKEQASLSAAAVHVFKNAVTEKSETPEIVETVLPLNHNKQIEVAEDKQQTQEQQTTMKQAENISNKIIKPSSQEEPKISQQLNFNEQSPEQHEQFGQPTAQEQVDVNEYYDPYDLRRQPIEQCKDYDTIEANQNQLDKKEQSTEDQILRSVEANQEELDMKEQKQKTEHLKVLSSENADPKQLDKKEEPAEQTQILGSVNVSQEQVDIKEEKLPIEQIRIIRSEKEEIEPLHKEERPIQPKVLESFGAEKHEIDSRELPLEQPLVLGTSNAQKERLELKRQAIEQLKMFATVDDVEPLLKEERIIERTKVLTFPNSKEETTEHDSLTKEEAPERKTAGIQLPTKSEDPEDEFKKRLSSTILPLPRLNTDENLPLSVLLKRLRERSKIESFQDMMVPLGNKCKPPPTCPPPAPKCPPPPPCPPKPCPPPPPSCPKPSKPSSPSPCGPPKKKTPSCSKYIQVDADFDLAAMLREADIFIKKHMHETVTAILTKDVINRLEKMGVSLLITHPNEEIDVERLDGCELNSNSVELARDFEPWVPIPSWPIPRKVKKGPLVCPKDGCKILPPPKLNPPCKQNPCIGFPKRRNFSILDSFEMQEDVSVRSKG